MTTITTITTITITTFTTFTKELQTSFVHLVESKVNTDRPNRKFAFFGGAGWSQKIKEKEEKEKEEEKYQRRE